jgi:putative ABC transport system permease protein
VSAGDGGRRYRVFALATAHLRHEWVLTVCLVSALAAVLAPLLILLGLKEGTIETLRDRLVHDPVYREVRPAITRTFDDDWLEALSRDTRVAFLTPTILPASSALQLVTAAGGTELIDLVPTAAGDPLLLENGGRIPQDGECVLSSEAARVLGAGPGDRVEARVTRSRAGRMESETALLTVVSVLPPRAGGLARAYAPLGFVVDVEAYKEGRAVASRGWSGDSARPFMSFDGVILLLRAPLDPVSRTGLVINTGLLRSDPMPEDAFVALTGRTVPAGWHAYDLSVPSGGVGLASVDALKRKLRGRESVLLPYARDMRIALAGRDLPLSGLSLTAAQAEALGWPELPWGGLSATALNASRMLQVLLPVGTGGSVGGAVPVESLAGFAGHVALQFPLRVAGVSTTGLAYVPAELLGMLGTARERAVAFDQASGELVMERAGYRGFRLYAHTIDHVPELVALLRDEGIEVVAEVEDIRRIQVLDRGLSQLFWLIAALGVAGAAAVLVASLYAAVERERRDLGVLRLIGLSRADVFWFPLFQGGLIALLGMLLGWSAYLLLAEVINRVFGDELSAGQAICRLPPSYPWLALLTTVGLALLSALVAASKATRIDPAEAIREE